MTISYFTHFIKFILVFLSNIAPPNGYTNREQPSNSPPTNGNSQIVPTTTTSTTNQVCRVSRVQIELLISETIYIISIQHILSVIHISSFKYPLHISLKPQHTNLQFFLAHHVKVNFGTDTQRPARNPGNAQSNPDVASTTVSAQSPDIFNRFGADDDLDSMAAVPSIVVCSLLFFFFFLQNLNSTQMLNCTICWM